MPDRVTDKERAAIEAFHASGREITRCATGESGIYDSTGSVLDHVGGDRKVTAWGRKADPRVQRRREKVAAMMDEGKSSQEICKALDTPYGTIMNDARMLNRSFSGRDMSTEGPRKRRPPESEVAKRVRRVCELADTKTHSLAQIAEKVGVPLEAVRRDLRSVGRSSRELPGRTTRGRVQADPDVPVNKALEEKFARYARHHARNAKPGDNRRFKVGPVPTGHAPKSAPADAVATLHPKTVVDPGGDRVLKDGSWNQKIGGRVLVGWLTGARIRTLTLEERATCPTACRHWQSCYGNTMGRAVRFRHGPALLKAIRRDLEEDFRTHELLQVRLHVLGDFYSTDYVAFWCDMLHEFPGLHCFGFTAWRESSPIGKAVASVRDQLLTKDGRRTRFAIRHSGTLGPWGSATLPFQTTTKMIGDGIVCPEQRDHVAGVGLDPGDKGLPAHCGDCTVCWTTDRTVLFIEHGGKA